MQNSSQGMLEKPDYRWHKNMIKVTVTGRPNIPNLCHTNIDSLIVLYLSSHWLPSTAEVWIFVERLKTSTTQLRWNPKIDRENSGSSRSFFFGCIHGVFSDDESVDSNISLTSKLCDPNSKAFRPAKAWKMWKSAGNSLVESGWIWKTFSNHQPQKSRKFQDPLFGGKVGPYQTSVFWIE